MRVLLGLLVLITLFWMAASWQARHTGRLRREREQVHGRVVRPSRFAQESADPAVSELAPPPGHSSAGWSTLVVGRPSAAAPRVRTDVPAPWTGDELPDAPTGRTAPLPTSSAAPARADEFRYRVRRGDVLGTICADYYGAERGPFDNLTQLTLAVAHYNDMQSPDAIVVGDEIRLPPIGTLER